MIAAYDKGRMTTSPAALLANKAYGEPSVFEPRSLLREARRQKALPERTVPAVCLLDPDGDLVGHLCRSGAARPSAGWACYHTQLWEFDLEGRRVGIVGRAVGASFAVLVAEELFASGCRLLISVTSAGRLGEVDGSPCFVVIDRALRDEGTSYHYLAPGQFVDADPRLVAGAMQAVAAAGGDVRRGASWTTDAPFRETPTAVAAARALGILAVEMEAAGLYAFAQARRQAVLCIAHLTNTMGLVDGDFEKGEAEGAVDVLALVAALIRALAPEPAGKEVAEKGDAT